MIGNARGYGILSLIITLGVIVAVSYFVLQSRQSGKSDEAVLRQIEAGDASSSNASTAHPSPVVPTAGCATAEQNCSVH